MEDSNNIERQEKLLTSDLQPKIEEYIKKQFGEPRYIDTSYDLVTGKPMIVVTFNANDKEIAATDFDAFIAFLKENAGVEHANVIVDYWTKELSINKEY
ncbi:hypothetical protein [Ureibacillus sinduriensis]|uniref:Uncharacterized protein n=1 Tax=Ureibacillus sinduriensis BLB-1 = JCM 15800 TaxID=1384057 RepID=A0A0A3HVH7_9BACL|nr:hypothetical protein [Ureibacillus sinduriensis]KGR74283.1 hypothetical protein CD33_20105 [Ureibacillus sinduriensis BLB-1 = JCM 15800]